MKDCIREYFFNICRQHLAPMVCMPIYPICPPMPCPPPKPAPPCTKKCVSVKERPVCTEKQLCARIRIPPYRRVKKICVELLDTQRRRGSLVICYKVKICYVDIMGCCREYCTVLRSTCWDIDVCGYPQLNLVCDPQYDICGCCLFLSFDVAIKYWKH